MEASRISSDPLCTGSQDQIPSGPNVNVSGDYGLFPDLSLLHRSGALFFDPRENGNMYSCNFLIALRETITYPLPVGVFESMIFLFQFGGICFLVPSRVTFSANSSPKSPSTMEPLRAVDLENSII